MQLADRDDFGASPQGPSVRRTTKQAYAFVWIHKYEFIKLAFLPFILFVLGKTFLNLGSILHQAIQDLGIESVEIIQLLALTTSASIKGLYLIFIVTLFSVVWHRRFLIKSETQAIPNLIDWRKRHARFLITAIVFSLVGGLLATPAIYLIKPLSRVLIFDSGIIETTGINPYLLLVLFGLLLRIILISIGAALLARWCLMFPAIATDNFLSFGDSWRLSSGNALRLTSIII